MTIPRPVSRGGSVSGRDTRGATYKSIIRLRQIKAVMSLSCEIAYEDESWPKKETQVSASAR